MYASIYTFKQVGSEFVEKDKQKIPSQCITQGTLSVNFGIYVHQTKTANVTYTTSLFWKTNDPNL
jgi:hypothetical protein